MSEEEKCEGGEGIAHLIRVGVGTFQVNKKQIVTAEQSHLWRFNTLIHTNAHTHTTHSRRQTVSMPCETFLCVRATHSKRQDMPPSISPSPERTLVSLISDIFTVCGTQDAYK